MKVYIEKLGYMEKDFWKFRKTTHKSLETV